MTSYEGWLLHVRGKSMVITISIKTETLPYYVKQTKVPLTFFIIFSLYSVNIVDVLVDVDVAADVTASEDMDKQKDLRLAETSCFEHSDQY